jgi:hypothetical protein
VKLLSDTHDYHADIDHMVDVILMTFTLLSFCFAMNTYI